MSKKYKHMSAVKHTVFNPDGTVSKATISKNYCKSKAHRIEVLVAKCKKCDDYNTKVCLTCKTYKEISKPDHKHKKEILSYHQPMPTRPDYKEVIHNEARNIELLKHIKELSDDERAIIALRIIGLKKTYISAKIKVSRPTIDRILDKFK